MKTPCKGQFSLKKRILLVILAFLGIIWGNVEWRIENGEWGIAFRISYIAEPPTAEQIKNQKAKCKTTTQKSKIQPIGLLGWNQRKIPARRESRA